MYMTITQRTVQSFSTDPLSDLRVQHIKFVGGSGGVPSGYVPRNPNKGTR
ncbi:hypothetical protein [Pseudoalteromonas sp. OOF1S-7]|nr:hypothetical protein [Pseudoalteromonas sp. OOF1S-7]MCG7534630.1 hypothetical protein [Pseudoalteromonas sp. OOF1S-7]